MFGLFVVLSLISDSSCLQAESKIWKKKTQKTAPPPIEQVHELTGANEAASEEESNVEFDSLGRVFIELADAPLRITPRPVETAMLRLFQFHQTQKHLSRREWDDPSEKYRFCI